ncbi:MAG: DUF2283 domain-containing protein [Bacteroidia bacterium]|nr:DUF2283 domain-containing protein [Bacteroidia bacterium]
METLKILDKKEHINWDYDEEADVLYLSIDKPQKALGVDMGDGIIVRYKEKTNEIVGLTIIGIKQRTLNAIRH